MIQAKNGILLSNEKEETTEVHTTWVNLTDVRLSESQTQKTTTTLCDSISI